MGKRVIETKPLRGMLDLAPEEGELWVELLKGACGVLERYGYRFIRTPVVERKELFVRSVGETTDIVEKEMYEFQDRKGTPLVLRPEETASVVRMFIDKRLFEGRPYLKVYTFGPMFRYERPQKGRQREFYQIDVEFMGVKDPFVEIEGFMVINEIVEKWGVGSCTYKVNHIGCERDRDAFKKALRDFLRDKELCEDCRRRVDRNVLRVLDCKREVCRKVVEASPRIDEFLCEECRGYMAKVLDVLGELGLSVEVDTRLVRGLDYYTGFVFEVVSGELGAQNAFIGGGRYDNLVRDMGGPNTPAFGFGIGIDRIFSVLRERKAPKVPHVFLCPLDEDSRGLLFELGRRLREKGLWVEGGYEVKSLKSQLKSSHRAGAKVSLIMGEDERGRGAVLMRDMASGNQKEVPLSAVLEEIEGWLEG